MARGVRWYLVGSLVLVTLAGCGRSFLQYAERDRWRREAEVACLNSGAVKEGSGVVRIAPIGGPGICGADFPLKVAALGGGRALGFNDEAIRPPGSIPNASQPMPRWPVAPSRSSPTYQRPVQAMPPSIYTEPRRSGEPMPLTPYGGGPQANEPYAVQRGAGAPPSYPAGQPHYGAAPPRLQQPVEYEVEDDPQRPPRGAMPHHVPSRPLPPLGPPRGPQTTIAAPPVGVTPVATLACPIVSALDQWIVNAVQPAAQRWFRQPVVEIKQISAYSCRGMNGQPGARISEHAFGNALDIAAFILADGRRVTVKNGWRGSPEEQGFLRDVQGAACEQFTTVLAPGSNRFHYDHIHVDLMRRSSGRRICQPGAVDGELIASRARRNPVYAARHDPPPTRVYDPPFDARNDPFAWRGDSARRGDPSFTGSVGATHRPAAKDDDNDWIEDDSPRPQVDWSRDRHRVQ